MEWIYGMLLKHVHFQFCQLRGFIVPIGMKLLLPMYEWCMGFYFPTPHIGQHFDLAALVFVMIYFSYKDIQHMTCL